jgi:1,4-dihydroxy-2-naphthoate octaprenyltransferase
MARPDQLLLMAVVYATGVAVAVARGAAFAPVEAVVGFLAFVPLAASVHYANEYADYETDLLARRTPFSGGSGALAATGLPRSLALRAAAVALGVGGVATGLAWETGTVGTAAVGVAAAIVVLGWEYSLPPLALAWRGAGELDNALLGGVLLPVYGVAAAAGTVTPADVAVFVPFGCLVFVNLLATTWPDRHPDAAVGKLTLATRLEPSTLRGLYLAGVTVAAVSVGLLSQWPAVLPGTVAAVLAASLVPVAAAGVAYTRRHSPAPTVVAMVLAALLQLGAWVAVAAGVA